MFVVVVVVLVSLNGRDYECMHKLSAHIYFSVYTPMYILVRRGEINRKYRSENTKEKYHTRKKEQMG